VDGAYIYMVGGGKGLCVLENQLYGIEESKQVPAAKAGLRVSPSVVAGRTLEVEWPQHRQSRLTLALSDASGRAVGRFEAQPALPGHNRYRLELPALPTGVYVLRVCDAPGARGARFALVSQ
jgi:hypothetical protein